LEKLKNEEGKKRAHSRRGRDVSAGGKVSSMVGGVIRYRGEGRKKLGGAEDVGMGKGGPLVKVWIPKIE